MAAWGQKFREFISSKSVPGNCGSERNGDCLKNGTVAWCVHLFKFTGLHKPFGTQNNQDEKEELLGNDRYWLSLRGSGSGVAQKQI